MLQDTGKDKDTESSTDQNQRAPIILVVEDCEEVLWSLREILESHKYLVIPAENGAEALKEIARKTPDLILSDIVMPEIDGLLLHKEVRQNPTLSEVPFVFLTAVHSDSQRRQAKLSGCDDYLTKPIEPEELLTVIEGKLAAADRRKKSMQDQLHRQYRKIIHTLSHEFRTPLVSVNTGAEVILEQFDRLSADQIKTLVGSILKAGQRLEHLVEDFMVLQKADLGHAVNQSVANRSAVPLFPLVEEAIAVFSNGFLGISPAPLVRIAHNPGEKKSSHYVDVYDTQVIDVIQRLLSNAYKFGESAGDIDLRVEYYDDGAEIIIRDYGPGLNSKSALRKICDPFVQIDREKQEQQGCGVGLTIARYLAELNDVKLFFIDPQEGGGLEAHLRFAAATAKAATTGRV